MIASYIKAARIIVERVAILASHLSRRLSAEDVAISVGKSSGNHGFGLLPEGGSPLLLVSFGAVGDGEWGLKETEGMSDAVTVGSFDGTEDGDVDGALEGDCDGAVVTVSEGDCDGVNDGEALGNDEGESVGGSRNLTAWMRP